MIMRQPDCLLKEYLEEIHNRYGVTVCIEQFSRILKGLRITHKKVYQPTVTKLSANLSLQKKRHNEIQNLGMHGFERSTIGTLNKLFSLMNLALIRALEHVPTVGGPKVALSPIQYNFKIAATSVSFLL